MSTEKKTGKKTVHEIIADRIIEKIKQTNRVPWHAPFASSCMNWYSKTEYRGINRILLNEGEYITMRQLNEYNEKNGTSFKIDKGTHQDIVVFYSQTKRKLSEEEVEDIQKNGIPSKWLFNIVQDKDGNYYRLSWILKYYGVFNIDVIHDENGNTLEPHMGNDVVEIHTPAENIIDKYCTGSGVKILYDGNGQCFYSHLGDAVHMTSKKYFDSTEEYYRTVFHELTHSTGIKGRLNRSCFEKYSQGTKERSREELVAEMGSLFLASEAGFKDDYCTDNSENYIASWCKWMKDNPNELVTGIYQAEKAKEYILAGGVLNNADYHSDTSEGKIV